MIVTRMGHMGLRVPDLDAAVEFQRQIVGMVETERTAGAAYLTCNERHHELILIQDPARRGYDHIGLEVPDPQTLEAAIRSVPAAGGMVLGDVYDGEPGIDRALRVRGPGGHVFKLFCGMEADQALDPGDRPIKFEHASVKSPRPGRLERFLEQGLGFRFSDRMGPFASWWHCDADHHGMAIVLAPKNELSHYAYAFDDLNAMGRVADRLKRQRDQKLIWGPSRHGPGNNHFAYLHDHDGAMIELCSELAQMPPVGDYQAREWPIDPTTLNQWSGRPPLRFILTGFPIVGASESGRPAWAMRADRTPSLA
jgi:catechol 2,3-dioxygenase-like lactoylglutathione lyase family enzyme